MYYTEVPALLAFDPNLSGVAYVRQATFCMQWPPCTGWLIMLSKLMSGVYIGDQMTLSLANFGESNVRYCNAIKQQGKDEKKVKRMKRYLFALQSVGVNVGYIFGPGIYSIITVFHRINAAATILFTENNLRLQFEGGH